MTCSLYVNPPTVEIINGKRVVVANGGRACQGRPGETEVFVRIRIRENRRFWPDRTIAESGQWGTTVEVGTSKPCPFIGKVFAEVLLPRFPFAQKVKSKTVSVSCSQIRA